MLWKTIIWSSLGVIYFGHAIYGYRQKLWWKGNLAFGTLFLCIPWMFKWPGMSLQEVIFYILISIIIGLGPALLWWVVIFWKNDMKIPALICVSFSIFFIVLLFWAKQYLPEYTDEKITPKAYPTIASPGNE